MKNVVIGCDHAAFAFKLELADYLKTKGFVVFDEGTYKDERCDYPDYAEKVCNRVQRSDADWGLLLCGTGIGMSMAANKLPNIRAAVVSDCFSASATRKHNNANVLCLGSRVVGIELAKKIIDCWCSSSFEGGRHETRVTKMMKLHRGES